MAQRIRVELVDDLDGSDATETVAFGLDGTNYEVDLNESNATRLRHALADFVEIAREVKGRRKTTRVATVAPAPAINGTTRPKPKDVREWAAANGVELSGTGRIPATVVKQYEAAQA